MARDVEPWPATNPIRRRPVRAWSPRPRTSTMKKGRSRRAPSTSTRWKRRRCRPGRAGRVYISLNPQDQRNQAVTGETPHSRQMVGWALPNVRPGFRCRAKRGRRRGAPPAVAAGPGPAPAPDRRAGEGRGLGGVGPPAGLPPVGAGFVTEGGHRVQIRAARRRSPPLRHRGHPERHPRPRRAQDGVALGQGAPGAAEVHRHHRHATAKGQVGAPPQGWPQPSGLRPPSGKISMLQPSAMARRPGQRTVG